MSSNTYTKMLASNLAEVLTETTRAKHHMEYILRQPYIKHHTKNFLNTAFMNRLNLIEKDMLQVMGDDARKIIEEAILNIEASFRTGVVYTSFQTLSEENKSKVEDFMSQLMQEQIKQATDGKS